PQPPPPKAEQPAPAPQPPVQQPPPRAPEPAGWPTWAVGLLVAVAALLVACLALMAFIVAERRRARAEAERAAGGAGGKDAPARAGQALPGTDRLPEVRRALVEDRLLARRVLGELLAQNELDKVARTVELVGPAMVDDLRSD